MNDKKTAELITLWLDGAPLSEEEVSILKEVHANTPDLLIDPKEYNQIRDGIKSVFTDSDIPNPELFQSSLLSRLTKESEKPEHDQILEQLESIKSAASSAPPTLEEKPVEENKVVNYPWPLIMASMAACFVFGFLADQILTPKAVNTAIPLAEVAHPSELSPVVFTSDHKVSANFETNKSSNIIVIEGLDAIPDDLDLFKLSQKNKPSKTEKSIGDF